MSRLLEALRTLEDRRPVDVDDNPVVDESPVVDERPAVDEEGEVDVVSDSLVDDALFPCEESAPRPSEEEASVLAEEPLGDLPPDPLDEVLDDKVLVIDDLVPPPAEEERPTSADEDSDRLLPSEVPVSLEPSAPSEIEQLPAMRQSVVQEVSHVEQMVENELGVLNVFSCPSEDPTCIDENDEVLAKTDESETSVDSEELVAPVEMPEGITPATAPERNPIEIPLEWRDHHPEMAESAKAMLSLLSPSTSIPIWMMIGVDEAERRLPWISVLAMACSQQLEGTLLLVDGDLARRQLTRRLHVDDQPGLAEVLNDRSIIDPLLIPTSFKNLWYLPAGIGAVPEGDYSRAIAAMFAKTGDRFSGVMIDGGSSPFCRKGRQAANGTRQKSPPWQPARLAEDLFLDVRLGESTESQIQRVVDSIVASGITPRGCIAV